MIPTYSYYDCIIYRVKFVCQFLPHHHHIHPVPNEKYWANGPYNAVHPPPLRKPPGRPTKNRRKEAENIRMEERERDLCALSFKICGTLCHNRKKVPKRKSLINAKRRSRSRWITRRAS